MLYLGLDLTYLFTSCPRWARARANFKTQSPRQTSTRDRTTTMAPMDNALADLELREEDENFTL
jgi:hypothetical protein